MSDQPEPVNPAEDPVQAIQQVLAGIEPEAMVIGFATVVEWMEADGSTCLSLIHSPMPPWHMHGLLTYARESYCNGELVPIVTFEDEDDDDF